MGGEARESSPRAMLGAVGGGGGVMGSRAGEEDGGGRGAAIGTRAQGSEEVFAGMFMPRLEGGLNPGDHGDVTCQRGSHLCLALEMGMKKAFQGPSQDQGSLCSGKTVP